MMKDSPVKFPDKGALLSKYPPDVTTSREAPEKNYSISGTPQRSLEQIARIQAEMPKGEVTPPSSLLPLSRESDQWVVGSRMFERRARNQEQSELWVLAGEFPAATPEAFCRRVNATLEKTDFARQVRAICEPAYADASRGGRPGIDPVVYLNPTAASESLLAVSAVG